MADQKLEPYMIEDAKIIFRNFGGKGTVYNREGDRNFCVLLGDTEASAMAAMGWNVKTLKPREEGDAPQPYIQVTVKFTGKPPRITLISSAGRTVMNEGTVGSLDVVDIAKADIMINPYYWDINGKQGITAYLKTAFITIDEDELERRYAEGDDD